MTITIPTLARAATVLTFAASAAVPVASAGASQAHATRLQQREVCAQTAYLKREPGRVFVGTALRGDKLEVERYSATRRFARVVRRVPGHAVRGWIEVAYLCKTGQTA